MAVLYINLNEGNNVFKDINRTKDELNYVLSYLNSAYNQMSGAIYINGLQNYRDRITSEKRLVQDDITKVINFSKAYKNFLDNAKEIDKNYAKIISDEGYAYRKETGLLKEEWKRAGKLIIGTLVIAGTVIAAVFIGGPILIGAAVGACVSATLGAGMGYLTGGKDGAIDGFFSGAITGALSGAIGAGIAGVPPAMGSAPKEILKFMGKQSLIDGGVEGLGGGILGFINDGTKGAIKGSIGGFVSGAVTGLISGGVSFKFQKPKVSPKNLDDVIPENITNNINKSSFSKQEIYKFNSFKEEISTILEHEGITLNEFNNMRMKLASELSDEQKRIMIKIRESVKAPDNDTILQKVFHGSQIDNYLKETGQWDTIGGFITKAEDVKDIGTLREVYEGLRLDYDKTPFNPDLDNDYGLIRFKTDATNKIDIPYGAAMEDIGAKPPINGFDKSLDPFTGHGFTKDINGNIIPEYTIQYLKPNEGAELYRVDSNTGIEELIAIFKDNRFIRI